MANRQPGWWEDPSTAGRVRWWDGTGWTRWVATDRHAPAPPFPGEHVVPQPTAADRALRVAGWVALGLAALLAVLTGAGMYVNHRDAPPLPAQPSRGPSASIPQRPFGASLEDRTLLVGAIAQMELPHEPFGVPERVGRDGLFAEGYLSEAPDTGAGGDAPPSTVLAGLARDGLFVPTLERTGVASAATDVAHRFYATVEPTIGAATVEDGTLDGRPAWSAEVPVTYTVDGKEYSSTVTAVLVQARFDTWLLWTHTPGAKAKDDDKAAAKASRTSFKVGN